MVPHRALCLCPAINLTPAALPEGGANEPYPLTTLTPTAGTSPFNFFVAGLPAGMTPTAPVSGDDVTIAGTPTADFEGTVTVSGTDFFSCPFTRDFPLRIGVPTISINDVSVTEGNSGLTPAVFTVTLSHPSTVPVSVRWHVAARSAKAGTTTSMRGRTCCRSPP